MELVISDTMKERFTVTLLFLWCRACRVMTSDDFTWEELKNTYNLARNGVPSGALTFPCGNIKLKPLYIAGKILEERFGPCKTISVTASKDGIKLSAIRERQGKAEISVLFSDPNVSAVLESDEAFAQHVANFHNWLDGKPKPLPPKVIPPPPPATIKPLADRKPTSSNGDVKPVKIGKPSLNKPAVAPTRTLDVSPAKPLTAVKPSLTVVKGESLDDVEVAASAIMENIQKKRGRKPESEVPVARAHTGTDINPPVDSLIPPSDAIAAGHVVKVFLLSYYLHDDEVDRWCAVVCPDKMSRIAMVAMIEQRHGGSGHLPSEVKLTWDELNAMPDITIGVDTDIVRALRLAVTNHWAARHVKS